MYKHRLLRLKNGIVNSQKIIIFVKKLAKLGAKMQPKKNHNSGQFSLIAPRLDTIINMQHELVRLTTPY